MKVEKLVVSWADILEVGSWENSTHGAVLECIAMLVSFNEHTPDTCRTGGHSFAVLKGSIRGLK
jgi:hypothetical protein